MGLRQGLIGQSKQGGPLIGSFYVINRFGIVYYKFVQQLKVLLYQFIVLMWRILLDYFTLSEDHPN